MSNGYFTKRWCRGSGRPARGAVRKVQTFSFGNLDRMETGQIITRLTNDVNHVQEAIMMILRMAIRSHSR